MENIIGAIETFGANIVLMFSLPLIYWLIKWRKEEPFFRWIGLYKPKLESARWVLLVFAIIYAANYFLNYSALMPKSDIAIIEANNASIALGGFSDVVAAFIVNVFANGLCEEAFFRGFLAKRLIANIGFYPGIIVQASAFALMHNALWLIGGLGVSIITHIVMFAMTFIAAIMLVCLNERIFNASIVPSFVLHGLGNFVAALLK